MPNVVEHDFEIQGLDAKYKDWSWGDLVKSLEHRELKVKRLEEMLVGLNKYIQHDPWCSIGMTNICSCGLSSILKKFGEKNK